MKAAIENILIKERIRKEITRIPELAADIEKNGLINPITVMPLDGEAYQLLAGLRRIRAVQELGWTEIEVNLLSPTDAEAALQIEISENEQREDFTFSERIDYGRLLEDIEQAKAKDRMLAGKQNCGVDPVSQGTQGQTGRTREIVGAKIGMSGTQFERAKYIAEKAPAEVIEQLDKGERTIRRTYDELKAKEKNTPPPTSATPPASPPPAPSDTPAPQPKRPRAVSKEETMKYLSEADKAALRKLDEFNAMTPEEKVTELQRRLREERARAATAESELALLKERYSMDIGSKESIIEGLRIQIKAANARIAELEATK